MHICFFIGSMVRGGAERVIYLLANYYSKIGWKVDIALLLKNEVDYEQFPLDKRIRCVDLTNNDTVYLRNAFKWSKQIRNHCKETKPDCIISFIGRINALVLTATAGLRIPTIVSERNDPRHDGRGKAMLSYCNMIYKRSSAIVFQTKYEQSCFSSSLNRKSHVIPNPVAVTPVNGVNENPYEISTAGRLELQKNHIMLIDAISIVKNSYPNICCRIYGDGSLRGELERRIKQLSLESNVYLSGNRIDINNCVAQSSVFVMTSEFEGLSNALIEAMMLGKACITTDYPGAEEIIENEVNGIIVPRGEAGLLAEAILSILDSPEKRVWLGNNALVTSRSFEAEEVIQKWKSLIECIVKNHVNCLYCRCCF